jgi:hypothetical protein
MRSRQQLALFGVIVLGSSLLMNLSTAAAEKPLAWEAPGLGLVRVLNASGKQVDKTRLLVLLEEIVRYADQDKLEPYLVEISSKHKIVTDARRSEAITVTRANTNQWNLLIPTKNKGQRIILHRIERGQETYKMCGLPEGAAVMDFSQCIK